MSSFSDKITNLLKGGISEVTFGMSPEGQPFVGVIQNLATGSRGNIIQIRHQRQSTSIAECIDAVTRDVEHCAQLHVPTPDGKIIQAPRG